MANSYQRATSDGTMTYIDISIDYLDRSEITVYFNDVLTTAWSWSGSSDKRVLFSPAVPNGVVVMVKRITDASALRHEFSKGAAFTADTLDEDLRQALHMAQEANEANLVGDFFTEVNLHGFRLRNVGTAVDSTDALTLGQYQADALGAHVARFAAEAAAAEAAATAAAANVPALPDAPALSPTGTEAFSLYSGAFGKLTLSRLGNWLLSSLTGFSQGVAGAISRTFTSKVRETVSCTDFASIQDAVDAMAALPNGGTVLVPAGNFLLPGPIVARNNVTLRGVGHASRIYATTDISLVTSDTTTPSSAVFGFQLVDLALHNTVAGVKLKYDVHLQNPQFCKVIRCHVMSGHTDLMYSATNVGGVFFDKPDLSTAPAYCNEVRDSWIQNNSVYFRNITDSLINGGWVWGHVRQFAIRIRGGGANAVEKVAGIICSQYCGGIWLDGGGVNQIRIEGNEFDGNPLLIRGDGILSPQNTTQVTVSGNTFWACGKNGISTTDPVGWSITGNNFWKNNDSDGGYDDIRIIGATFQPNGNVVSGNTFTMDVARTAKGYPIREVNAGFFPVANVYQSNGIVGAANYLGGILILNNAKYDGTLGGAAKLYANVVNVGMGDSPGLLLCAAGGTVAAGGTLDMAINTETFGGAPGGFAGNLSVSATRSNFPTQSRRTVYNTAAYGTTATFSSATSQDGSGGGSAFTLTMVSNGVVRFTDTSGSGSSIEVRMAFVGAKSLA